MENRKEQIYEPVRLQNRRHSAEVLEFQPQTIAMVQPQPPSNILVISTVNLWLRGKNLDFCLLAVCSCVLAVLCHQTVHLSPTSSVPASASASSSRVMPSQLNFMLKAGLFTTLGQRSEAEEEGEE